MQSLYWSPKSQCLSAGIGITLHLVSSVPKRVRTILTTSLDGRIVKCCLHCNQTLQKRLISQSPWSQFVPKSQPVQRDSLEQLQTFVHHAQKLLVLTGAGISTESGIPDYRSDGVGLYARSGSRPIQYHDFIHSAARRQRYWARNFVGWPQFRSFRPNQSHMTLASWEEKGKLHWLVTQNVDALHTKAGSRKLTELHGCTHRIVCMNCKTLTSRDELQERMNAMNPAFHGDQKHNIAPDGDVLLPDELVANFRVPACTSCGGLLKPHLVFFGDNVDPEIKEFVFQKVDESDAVLVIGSSLEVYSGYRFVHTAWQSNKPIAIVNIGNTRADKLEPLKIEAKISEVLQNITVT
ncbi:NAD-dependent protein lipoamidase sirtuin-4, mitochondrial-like [Diadema setosum]|uniref:NAD-dependent protein lipoamidase sirtuin-4, mitochondrial-like n=1 Tax=Diadema setosum TaxID=31175 RepID=UPI003B3B1AB3